MSTGNFSVYRAWVTVGDASLAGGQYGLRYVALASSPEEATELIAASRPSVRAIKITGVEPATRALVQKHGLTPGSAREA
jgi:hypothetical protein